MATTDLKLDEPGSLPSPGPIGRLLRLAFGSICAWYVFRLIAVSGELMNGDGHIIASLIGTPGCEMRAFHNLYSRITGIPTKEHYCPVGPLHPIDQWEARLFKS